MSRAYRIRVQESLRRILRAQDGVSTQLELLPILEAEQMGALLRQELLERGFQEKGKGLVRQQQGITVTVDPETATVTVQADCTGKVELEAETEGLVVADRRASEHERRVQAALRQELRKDLEEQAKKQAAVLQAQITEQLEAQLGDLRGELDQVANRVTAEALKRKAAQLGQIKEIVEDPQSGSLTITLEV